jgi:putative redox protein
MKKNQKKLHFKNKEGQELAARLDLPVDQHPEAFILFAHCFTCNKNLTPVRAISKELTHQGFGVVRFDFTGLGESEGEFGDTNFSSNVQDLIAAAHFMRDELESPSLIIGHSLGGAAAIFAAHQIDSIQAVATIAAPSSPDHVKDLFKEDLAGIKENGVANVNIGGRGFTVKKQFLEDIKSKTMHRVLGNLRKPILVLHSPQDTIVGVENAAEIYQHARHPKSYISLDGADHLMSNKKDAVYAGSVIASWSKRYLELPQKKDVKAEGQVTVQIEESGYTSEVRAGKHHLRADEPVDVGGDDFGPTPYDLVLSGLGACTAMTLRMYADRKKWDLQRVTVHLNHDKDHIEDCKDSEKKSSKIDVIERTIELTGELDEKQIQRLLEIADKCPVHKTLHSEVEVQTKIK